MDEYSENTLLLLMLKGNTAARNELVLRYDWIAQALARKYGSNWVPTEDILQQARWGIIKGLDNWKPKYTRAAQTHAYKTAQDYVRRLVGKELKHEAAETPFSKLTPEQCAKARKRT